MVFKNRDGDNYILENTFSSARSGVFRLPATQARIIAEGLRDMFNGSLDELNGVFYVSIGEVARVSVYEEGGKIFVRNFLPGASKEYLDRFREDILGAGAELVFVNDEPTISAPVSEASAGIILSLLRRIYDTFSYDKPKDSLKILGGFRVIFMGARYSAVARRSEFFKERFFMLPDEGGWFLSYMGQDCLRLPLLAWRHEDRIYLYVPEEDGNLRVFDLSDFVEKLRRLFDAANISTNTIDEVSVLSDIGKIEESVRMIEDAVEGAVVPFAFIEVDPSRRDEVRALIGEVKKGLELIKRSLGLSRYMEERVMLRIAVRIAKKVLGGEHGVLMMSTRKVSRLGAGYAVYISKEEAKIVGLGERVFVKVVAEEGEKPKIVIQ